MTKTTAAFAAFLMMALLVPHVAAQGQVKTVNIEDIATRKEAMPTHIEVTFRVSPLATATPVSRGGETPQSQPCGEYLVSSPLVANVSVATPVYYVASCGGISAGTWLIVEKIYYDGPSVELYRVDEDHGPNSPILFNVDSRKSHLAGGATFILTIIPPDLQARRLDTNFDAPVGFGMATETLSQGFPGGYKRVITVKGVYDGGLRAMFSFADITNRAVFVAPDTVQFDVSDMGYLWMGAFIPLTIAQRGNNQTVLIFHAPIPGTSTGKG